ncbi:MAG: amino acid transporter permease [Firmicutes bacterium]|nr:amino acid transporter permease [Bacillota bacterium]
MYYFELFQECLPSLLSGLYLTIFMALASILFAFIIGVILGLFSISNSRALRSFSTVYIYTVRGVPLMILALFLYFGVSSILGIRFNPVVAAIISLTINASAYMAEIFRGGIQAIDVGQMEASRSLGLGYLKTMQKVILPQAIKIMIPAFLNQFITTLKDTSILSVISVRELTLNGQIIIARNYLPFEVYSYVAVMYLIIITGLSLLTKKLERKLSYDNHSKRH